METKARATVEELYNVEDRAELVDGEIVRMSPSGDWPNYASGEIFASLREYARRTGRGRAFTEGAGFLVDLPQRNSFSPDASFYTGESSGMRLLNGAPIFAVEVRSMNDYGRLAERRLANKRADYFLVGTQVVWDVDLKSEDVVRVYHASDPERPAIYRRGQLAEAEPALPGWTMPVDDLFPAEWGVGAATDAGEAPDREGDT